MRSVDDKKQRCHLIIARFTTDYKKQVVITHIKFGVQCLICTVLNCERENLCNLWPLQTQKDSKFQIKQQKSNYGKK